MSKRQTILSFLRERKEDLRAPEIAAALGLNRSTVRGLLSEMQREGLVERLDTGLYHVRSVVQTQQTPQQAKLGPFADLFRKNPTPKVKPVPTALLADSPTHTARALDAVGHVTKQVQPNSVSHHLLIDALVVSGLAFVGGKVSDRPLLGAALGGVAGLALVGLHRCFLVRVARPDNGLATQTPTPTQPKKVNHDNTLTRAPGREPAAPGGDRLHDGADHQGTGPTGLRRVKLGGA